MSKNKSTITIHGNKKAGWIITIYGKDGFEGDIAVTNEELVELRELLNSKIK